MYPPSLHLTRKQSTHMVTEISAEMARRGKKKGPFSSPQTLTEPLTLAVFKKKKKAEFGFNADHRLMLS